MLLQRLSYAAPATDNPAVMSARSLDLSDRCRGAPRPTLDGRLSMNFSHLQSIDECLIDQAEPMWINAYPEPASERPSITEAFPPVCDRHPPRPLARSQGRLLLYRYPLTRSTPQQGNRYEKSSSPGCGRKLRPAWPAAPAAHPPGVRDRPRDPGRPDPHPGDRLWRVHRPAAEDHRNHLRHPVGRRPDRRRRTPQHRRETDG